MDLQRLAIVIGHTRQTGGATTTDGRTEHEVMAEFGRMLHERLRGHVAVDLYEHDYRGGYWRTVGPTIQAVNDTDADLVMELHFNAVPRGFPAWNSSGFLHWGNEELNRESAAGRAWGEHLAPALEVLGGKVWGTRPMDRSWNAPVDAPTRRDPDDGHLLPNGPPIYMLSKTKAPALLLEAFNGSNKAAVKRWDARKARVADALAVLLGAPVADPDVEEDPACSTS